MKCKAFALILAAALALLLASAVSAQYESSDKSPIGFRATIIKPTSSDLQAIKGTWFGPMIDWNAKYDKLDRPSLIVSTGWFGESSSRSDAKFTPLTATAIRHFGETGKNWYAGGGLGIYWASFKGTHAVYQVDNSDILPGIHLVAGYEAGAWFAEINLSKINQLSAPGGGIDFSGWGFSVGSHYSF